MATKKFSKMRFLRFCVKWKDAFQFVFGLICLFVIGLGVYHLGRWSINGVKYCYHAFILDDLNSIYNYREHISKSYWFYQNGNHGWIEETRTGKRVLKDVCWVVGMQNEDDTLLCYASNGYRGYLNKNTCQVVIPAKRYRKAWLFSEGLAAVMEEDSTLKFINPAGKVVIDKQFKYAPIKPDRGYLFKNGYCALRGFNHQWGLIDKEGKWAVIPEYDDLVLTKKNYWVCYKDGKQGLLNDSVHLIVNPDYREVLVTESGIEVLKEDFTRQLLDYNGNLIEHFIYTDIRDIYYKSGAVDPTIDEYEYELSPYKEYQTTYSSTSPTRVGLMGPDGKPITPPLYLSIEGVNANCFRCFYDVSGNYEGECSSVLINIKGQVIEAL